jgi:hypothetical protein
MMTTTSTDLATILAKQAQAVEEIDRDQAAAGPR